MKKLAWLIKKLGFKAAPCCILVASFLLITPHICVAYETEINNLSISMAEKIAKSGKKTIAVVDFTDLQGNITELGRFLAEELSSELVSAGRPFEVVDRMHLRTILSEHKLSLTGLIDPKTVKKLGQVSGVDAIVIGTVTPFGESVRLSIKVLATDTAKIIGSSRGNIPKTQAIAELLAREIETPTTISSQSERPGTKIVSKKKEAVIVPPKPGTPFQEFEHLRIEVESLQVTKDNNIMIFLRYFNKTSRNLSLALYSVSGYLYATPTFVTDDKGNEYRLQEVSGIRCNTYSNAYLNPLLVKPGLIATCSLKFKGSRDWQVGSLFSFTSAQGIMATDDMGNLKKDRNNNYFFSQAFNIW